MPAPAVVSSPALPPVVLPVFEGPLDLLLHLIREHKIDIADIPIVQVTDYYLGYLRALEAMNLTVAGEFLVMAATLLEIKSRMLLPKPPREETAVDEDGADPREELVQRLLDYQRYKAFVETLSGWEGDRRQLFFRGQAAYGDLYELPVSFGELSSQSLLKAIQRLLAETGTGEEDVTSVRRQKITLRLAMASLWRKVQASGEAGVLLDECFERPLVRLEIVMTFLALLELLRQSRVMATQTTMLGEIWLSAGQISGPDA
jgi:segregation and condensation protein A